MLKQEAWRCLKIFHLKKKKKYLIKFYFPCAQSMKMVLYLSILLHIVLCAIVYVIHKSVNLETMKGTALR